MSQRPELPEPIARDANAPLALDGVRIVDLSRLIAGPYATQLLADMGADVIKIENPQGGDDSRKLVVPEIEGQGAMYLWANRNKRSITLDLRQEQARQVVRDLVAGADVVVENFSAGVMERFGLGYDDLAAVNPRIVYCAISAFGRRGKFASRPGFDPIAQAESGLFSLGGHPDQPPLRVGASVIDVTTAIVASNVVLGALLARNRHGRGQYVEASLWDSAIALIGPIGMNYLMTGQDEVRVGNGSKNAAPAGLYSCADGELYLTCANDKTYVQLVTEVFARPDLATNPEFGTYRQRVRNAKALDEILNDCFSRQTCSQLLEKALEHGVPLGSVRSVAQAYSSEEMRDQKLLTSIPHPVAGKVPAIAAPFKMFGTPAADPVAPPLLGQHTQEILQGVLGYDAKKISALRESGALGTPHPAIMKSPETH
ncbi:MAG: CoA transferase [Polaromonas sp.]|nr:CoA transferase [Polaromonas sp.]